MTNGKASFFRRYFVPGLIFQGVLIGGGYGTGRELVEYFMKYGPLGGILGMFLITLVLWSLILAATFEFSRKFKLYDYRSLLLNLLGRFWLIFEVFFIVLLIVVLAVIGSAAGVLLRDFFGFPYLFGVGIMLASVGFLTFKGSGLIEKFLSGWSIFIYVVYALFLIIAIIKFGPLIQKNLTSGIILPKWAIGGLKYGLYNMSVFPAVLFCIRNIETRKEAISAGAIAALIGLLPGFFFYIAILGYYPAVVTEEIPAVFVIQEAGVPFLLVIFLVMLVGTLIETGTGFIHSVNERIQSAFQARGKVFPRWMRPVIGVLMLLISLCLSSFGIINLVAKGYGLMSWGVFFIYFVPLMTLGLYKILKK
ncbi:MAG: hypothetical protein JSV96_18535 [Candidatus Aminicenantes bacterium]|nr:MAG: hypothetical protein JSV96_18535 [Candidatus Aminicenantes bacterium]